MAKRVKDGRKVMRGQIATGSYAGSENRFQLFDGKFTTGYKIVEFKISPDDPQNIQEFLSKLTTEPDSSIGSWDWGDVQQVAWSQLYAPGGGTGYERNLIAEDTMIVKDLWISGYTTGTSPTPLNYYIVLEKYEFTAWDGAATMVRNLSQSGPA